MVAVLIDTPHFKFPFKLTTDGTRAMVVEQDSDEEIMDCLEVLLSTQPGERIELPDYGVPDQAFRENGLDPVVVSDAVRQWEERAEIFIETGVIENLAQTVTINYRRRES